ncbi:hypothetical protein FACS189483_00960 [Spirochaetia bacterium]|nr:hypothetical protein FACS189483_00960 [Spirochaetia bacterium]
MEYGATAHNIQFTVRRFAPPGPVRLGQSLQTKVCCSFPRLTTPTFWRPWSQIYGLMLRKPLIRATKKVLA